MKLLLAACCIFSVGFLLPTLTLTFQVLGILLTLAVVWATYRYYVNTRVNAVR